MPYILGSNKRFIRPPPPFPTPPSSESPSHPGPSSSHPYPSRCTSPPAPNLLSSGLHSFPVFQNPSLHIPEGPSGVVDLRAVAFPSLFPHFFHVCFHPVRSCRPFCLVRIRRGRLLGNNFIPCVRLLCASNLLCACEQGTWVTVPFGVLYGGYPPVPGACIADDGRLFAVCLRACLLSPTSVETHIYYTVRRTIISIPSANLPHHHISSTLHKPSTLSTKKIVRAERGGPIPSHPFAFSCVSTHAVPPPLPMQPVNPNPPPHHHEPSKGTMQYAYPI